jgi:hypothetical protein
MSLSFAAVAGGPDPAPVTLKVGAVPAAALNWGTTVSTTQGGSWLRATPGRGVTPGNLKVSVAPFGLVPGSYEGSVVVDAPTFAIPPRTIVVHLTVEAPAPTPAPDPVPAPTPGPAPSPGSGEVTMMWPVASAADDGREDHLGSLKTTTTVLPVGSDSLAAFRFAGVAIPRGAVIRSAVLYLYPLSNTSKHITLRYVGERSSNSAPLGRTAGDLSARPKTRAFVDDRPAPWPREEFTPSPELRRVVQEIVGQASWNPGNSLTIFVADNGSVATRNIGSFESRPGSTKAAVLVVTYR